MKSVPKWYESGEDIVIPRKNASERERIDHDERGMVSDMIEVNLKTLTQAKESLEGTGDVEFQVPTEPLV